MSRILHEDFFVLKTAFKVECFGLSDIGLIREKNEDAWRALPEMGLFVLADGMGGHNAGDIASSEAVRLLIKFSKDIEQGGLDTVLKKINQKIYEKALKDQNLCGMGTTLVVLYLQEEEGILAHVGDSRIYCLRKGKLLQLTEDHSLVHDLIACGVMKKEEGEAFPFKHILTRALGTHSQVEVTTRHFPLQLNDLFLLCSDGLTNFVPNKKIEDILNHPTTSLERKGYLLIDQAKKEGGGDNITVLLVDILENQ